MKQWRQNRPTTEKHIIFCKERISIAFAKAGCTGLFFLTFLFRYILQQKSEKKHPQAKAQRGKEWLNTKPLLKQSTIAVVK